MSRIFDELRNVEFERAGIDSPPTSEAFELLRRAEPKEASRPDTVSKGPINEGHRGAPPEPFSPIVRNQVATAVLPDRKPTSGIRRVVTALRVVLPIVQNILPLFDGNVGSAVSKYLTPHDDVPPAAQRPPTLDFTSIEGSLAKLQTGHRGLRDKVFEQSASIKVVEEQLELVREATDRNTLMQQELTEDLKSVGNRINFVSMMVLGLLAVSTAISSYLFLHILKLLR